MTKEKTLPNSWEDSQAGFISLEMLGGLTILILLLPMVFMWLDHSMMDMQKKSVAAHFNDINRAARVYAVAHSETLLPLATQNSGPTLTLDDLRAANLLTHVRSTNTWGQTYRIHVRKTPDDGLRLVILTEGGALPNRRDFLDAVIPATAALAGAGFVPSGKLPGQTDSMLQGAYGAWNVNLPDLGISSPGSGHLGALTDLNSNDLISDQLYRVKVPGKPELNEMWTTLDMTDQAIDNLKSVTFEPHNLTDLPCSAATEGRVFLDSEQGLYVCRKGLPELVADSGNSNPVKAATVTPNGLVDKPQCSPGHTPAIYVAPTIVSAGATSPPLAAVQAWATNESDTQWRVNLRVLRGDGKGWVTPPANYGRVMALAVCE